MENKLCMIGGGKLCKKAMIGIKDNYMKNPVTFIADKDKKKCGHYIENIPIISFTEAVSLYINGRIDKFVILSVYGVKTISELILELYESNVNEEDIFIYHDSAFWGWKQVKENLFFHFFDLFCEDERSHICEYLEQEKEQLSDLQVNNVVVVGKNWLAKYILSLNDKRIVTYEDYVDKGGSDSFFLICEEELSSKNYMDMFSTEKKIHVYNIIYHYFFANAIWYQALNTQKEKRRICGIATGISTIREAIQNEFIFNLANSAQDIFYDIKLLMKYGEIKKEEIQYVIMGLGPLALCYDMSVRKKTENRSLLYYPETKTLHNMKFSEFYSLYFDVEYFKLKNLLENFNVNECFEKYYLSRFKGVFNLGNLEFDENKLTIIEKNKIQEDIRELFYDCTGKYTVKENMILIKEYLQFCNEHGFPVIVFYPPYSNFYKEKIDKQIFAEVKNYIMSLKKIYNLKILDLSDLDLPDSMFYDYIHLNKKGRDYIQCYLNDIIEEAMRARR